MTLIEFSKALFWIAGAFWICKSTIPVLILVAKKKNLFDDDLDVRKIHSGRIPTFGGVAIFTAILIAFSASSYAGQFPGFGYYVAASAILFSAGLKDDILVIDPVKKLMAQIAAIVLVVFGAGITVTSLGGILGVSEIPYWADITITIFTMVVVINAINLIDGIDGLAASIGGIASLFFGAWFLLAGFHAPAVLSGITAASLVGFLFYNRPPAKIFMGDTGSLLIGLHLSLFAVLFVNYSVTTESVVPWQSAAPVLAAAVLIVPLYDTLRVFLIRLLRGGSPFAPDTEHVHHHLLRSGFSHGNITLYLCGVTVIAVILSIVLSGYLSNTSNALILLGYSLIVFPTYRFKSKLSDYILGIVPFTGASEAHSEVELSDKIEGLPESYNFDDEELSEEEEKFEKV